MRAKRVPVRWKGRARLVLLGLLVASAGFLGAPLASEAASHEAAPLDLFSHPRHKTRLKRNWGVEVMGVRRTAAGYILNFRYRVIDAEKAKPVFDRKAKPVLIDEATGAWFIVPALGKVGPLRNSNTPQEGRIYWMAFANPGGFVKRGDLVTVVIGDFRAEHLVVQ